MFTSFEEHLHFPFVKKMTFLKSCMDFLMRFPPKFKNCTWHLYDKLPGLNKVSLYHQTRNATMQRHQNGHIETRPTTTKKPAKKNTIKFQKHKIAQGEERGRNKFKKYIYIKRQALAKVVLKKLFSNYCFSLKVSASCTWMCWLHCLLSANLSLSGLRVPGGQESRSEVIRFHCLFYSLDLFFS